MKMESEAIDKIHNLRHSKSRDLANQVLWFTSWEIPSDVSTCPDISPNFLESYLTVYIDSLSIWHYTIYVPDSVYLKLYSTSQSNTLINIRTWMYHDISIICNSWKLMLPFIRDSLFVIHVLRISNSKTYFTY